MMPNLSLLAEYRYDALNRLISCTGSTQTAAQRFYRDKLLVTEVQGAGSSSIMQYNDQLLAQQQCQGNTAVQTALLATDPSRSVLRLLGATQTHVLNYPPYGHSPPGNGLLSLLGFNGERLDPETGCYLLGTGYHRSFNPVLMRFNSPDTVRFSPFGRGGLNSYSFCVGDPVNRADPMGHASGAWGTLINAFSDLIAPAFGKKVSVIKNLQKLDTGLIAFEDTTKQGLRRINFNAHGVQTQSENYLVRVNGKNLTASDLYDVARQSGVDFNDYDKVRTLICYSGNGGTRSFGSALSAKTGLEVKSFIGQVTSYPPERLAPTMEFGKIYPPSGNLHIQRKRGIALYLPPEHQPNYQPVKFNSNIRQS